MSVQILGIFLEKMEVYCTSIFFWNDSFPVPLWLRRQWGSQNRGEEDLYDISENRTQCFMTWLYERKQVLFIPRRTMRITAQQLMQHFRISKGQTAPNSRENNWNILIKICMFTSLSLQVYVHERRGRMWNHASYGMLFTWLPVSLNNF
jgi:hypothetical protein